jgi:hypothetical protein
MGYNARNDEIRDNITRMQRDFQAQREALATVRRFNAVLFSQGQDMVLAQDCRGPSFEAPLARYQLRQLRHRCGPGLAC